MKLVVTWWLWYALVLLVIFCCAATGEKFLANFERDILAAAEERERKLRDALQTIVDVASGEQQVADDDTAGMAWIDKYARDALKPTAPADPPKR
jgi:hypothetical protein